MRIALLFLLLGCASTAPVRRDWMSLDALIGEAHWRVRHCVDPNSEKCDALYLVREELEAIVEAAHEAFVKTHQAELGRLAP